MEEQTVQAWHDPRNPLVSLLPAMDSVSWPKRPSAMIVPVAQAITTRYDSDAMMQGYICPSEEDPSRGWRLHKRRKSTHKDEPDGYHTCTMLDLDRPNHQRWQEEGEAAAMMAGILETIRISSPEDWPLACYTTLGGLRLIYAFEHPCTAEQAEQTRQALRTRLLAARIELSPDKSTLDWTRLFRTPWAVRFDEDPPRPTWVPFEPVVWQYPDSAVPLQVVHEVEQPAVIEPLQRPESSQSVHVLPTADWQTTRIDEVPEEFEGLADQADYIGLAWQSPDPSVRMTPTPLAEKVIQVFAAHRGHKRKERAAMLRDYDSQAAAKALPGAGERNSFVFGLISDLCEAACKVRGASPEMALGIAWPLLNELTVMQGTDEDGRTWGEIAESRIGERWLSKRDDRRLELVVNEALPVELAEIPLRQLVIRPESLRQAAEAKMVSENTIRVWARLAFVVGRDDGTLDEWLDWYSDNGAGAVEGVSGSKTGTLLSPDFETYTEMPFGTLRNIILEQEWARPLQRQLMVEIKDKDGNPKIIAVESPKLFGIRYLPRAWPGGYPGRSPRRFRVDRRKTHQQTLFQVPTVWHQIDSSLQPVFDPFFDSLLRHFFGPEYDTFGRYYLRRLIQPDISKCGLLIEGAPGVGKSTFALAIARLYGEQGPAKVAMHGHERNGGLGKWTSDTFDDGPVFFTDDKQPNGTYIDFCLEYLGSGVARARYELKGVQSFPVEFFPIVVAATNNVYNFVATMVARCKDPAEKSALVQRFIVLSPERADSGEWNHAWRQYYGQGFEESDILRKFAEHLLFEGMKAIQEGVEDPKQGRNGGGNLLAYELSGMSILDQDDEALLASVTTFAASHEFLQGVRYGQNMTLEDYRDWPLDESRSVPARQVRFPDAVRWDETESFLVIGRWWVFRPGRLLMSLNVEGKAHWAARLREGGAAFIHSGRRHSLRMIDDSGRNSRAWMIDLFGMADHVGIDCMGERLEQYLKAMGYEEKPHA